MQIISTMASHNYKVPVSAKKQISHFVLVNHGKTFRLFSRTYKQNSRTFQDSKKKNPKLFQDVATLQVTREKYLKTELTRIKVVLLCINDNKSQ